MTIRETLNGASIFVLWAVVALLIWWIPRKVCGVV
jgi:hypothetical protein